MDKEVGKRASYLNFLWGAPPRKISISSALTDVNWQLTNRDYAVAYSKSPRVSASLGRGSFIFGTPRRAEALKNEWNKHAAIYIHDTRAERNPVDYDLNSGRSAANYASTLFLRNAERYRTRSYGKSQSEIRIYFEGVDMVWLKNEIDISRRNFVLSIRDISFQASSRKDMTGPRESWALLLKI